MPASSISSINHTLLVSQGALSEYLVSLLYRLLDTLLLQ